MSEEKAQKIAITKKTTIKHVSTVKEIPVATESEEKLIATKPKRNNLLFFAQVFMLLSLVAVIFGFSVNTLFDSFTIKTSLFVCCIGIAGVLFIFNILKQGEITFSRHPVMVMVYLIWLLSAISAFSSHALSFALFGYGSELFSLVVVSSLALLAFFASYFMRSTKKVVYALLVLITLFWVAIVLIGTRYGLAGTIVGEWLSRTTVSTFVGSARDFASLAFLVYIPVLFLLESKFLTWLVRIPLWLTGIAALVGIFAFGSFSLWVLGAIISFVFFVVTFSIGRYAKVNEYSFLAKGFPIYSLLSLIIFTLFAFSAPYGVQQTALSRMHIMYAEVTPPAISYTWNITKQAIATNPLVGLHLNSFSEGWQKYKPVTVNSDRYTWSLDFSAAAGYPLVMSAETGVLGFLSWLGLFVALLYSIVRLYMVRSENLFLRMISFIIVSITLTGWIVSFIYTLGPAVIGVVWFATGASVALFELGRKAELQTVSFGNSPVQSYIAVPILSALLVLLVFVEYVQYTKVYAATLAKQSVQALTLSGVPQALDLASKAAEIGKTDALYRNASTIAVKGLVAASQQLNNDNADQSLKRQQLTYFDSAQTFAQKAIAYNPNNYQNYIVFAKLLTQIAGDDGAYASAKNALDKANEIAPQSPIPLLQRAQLEYVHGNVEQARAFANQALTIKNNYGEAYFFLSQIEFAKQNTIEGGRLLEQAIAASPENPTYIYLLGQFYYGQKRYADAVSVLRQAILAVPSYADARYYLGLSLYRAGDRDGALEQFQYIEKTNPENKDVIQFVKNLSAGRSLFAE